MCHIFITVLYRVACCLKETVKTVPNLLYWRECNKDSIDEASSNNEIKKKKKKVQFMKSPALFVFVCDLLPSGCFDFDVFSIRTKSMTHA